MATKKRKSTTRRRSTSTATRSAPRKRRKSSPTKHIPSAGMTIGLAVANKDILTNIVNDPFSLNTYKAAAMQAIQPDRLKQDAMYGVGGYAAGWAIKNYAPKIVKEPLGKIAKKIPKVI